jgi:glycosyltransferase involved in cell wall biosynthesis
VGKIDNAATLLRAFDIFLLPSLKEGLPYVLLEAGLAGIPCVSSCVGGIPEIIENRVSGILVQPTADAIRVGLEFLMDHAEERKVFGAAIAKTVTEKFSLQQMLENTCNVYVGREERQG